MPPEMTYSINPAHGSPGLRRPRSATQEGFDDLEGSAEVVIPNLPAPIGSARTIPPRGPVASYATIEAQMIGERRGLRAGAQVIDQAKVCYNRTEWSGSQDRRAPKGRTTRTVI
jgi:hypothetical protein